MNVSVPRLTCASNEVNDVDMITYPYYICKQLCNIRYGFNQSLRDAHVISVGTQDVLDFLKYYSSLILQLQHKLFCHESFHRLSQATAVISTFSYELIRSYL